MLGTLSKLLSYQPCVKGFRNVFESFAKHLLKAASLCDSWHFRLCYFCCRRVDFTKQVPLDHVEFFAGKQAVTNAFLDKCWVSVPFEKLNDPVAMILDLPWPGFGGNSF